MPIACSESPISSMRRSSTDRREDRVTTLAVVISGGQTGVDQAVLRAAADCGLQRGGWCPPGRACEDGVIPAEFPLTETPADRAAGAPDVPRSMRTEWNVRDADATLVLQPASIRGSDAGTQWTLECAARHGRPLLVRDPADAGAVREVAEWIERHAVRVLNVAGPSERACPGIAASSHRMLRAVFVACRTACAKHSS
jgi:hypothetical protein